MATLGVILWFRKESNPNSTTNTENAAQAMGRLAQDLSTERSKEYASPETWTLHLGPSVEKTRATNSSWELEIELDQKWN